MNKVLLFVGILVLLTSCEKYSPEVREALRLSGQNKEQLEKVLRHYSSPADSLKYQAAVFLIANMPGHYTLRGDKIDWFRNVIDRDTACPYYYKKLYEIVWDHFVTEDDNVYYENDVEYVTADFLIRHIDASFELAYNQKLFDILPFDLFLEYVLPYRFGHERLDLWRDSLQVIALQKPVGIFPQDFFKLQSCFKLKDYEEYDSNFLSGLMENNPLGDCYYMTVDALLQSRALGMPATIDIIPFYSNRNGYHYWSVYPSLVFKESAIPSAYDRRTAKVYRRTFMRSSPFVPNKGEFVPEFFQDLFLHDVTSLYCHTVDIKINGNIPSTSCLAYLCVFNNLQWKPIVAGKVVRGEVVFSELAKNIVYLPVYYNANEEMVPFDFPFILDTKGKVRYLVPDKLNNISLHLERKNPDATNSLRRYTKSIEGMIVEGSDNEKFLWVDTVFRLDETDKLYYNVANFHSNKQYQWYRVKRKSGYNTFAELYFIDSKNRILKGHTNFLKRTVMDGDPLTNVYLNEDLVIYFDSAVNVDRLVCLPQSDGNGIYPGNVYELFYFDRDGWCSLGKQNGDKFYLEYKNVPGNALYWLRNLTTGVEERIFTSVDGTIIFW